MRLPTALLFFLAACGSAGPSTEDASEPAADGAVVRDSAASDASEHFDGAPDAPLHDASTDAALADGGPGDAGEPLDPRRAHRATRATSGNTQTASASYRLRVRVGAPQPTAGSASPRYRAYPY